MDNLILFVQKRFFFKTIYYAFAIVGKNTLIFISSVGRFYLFLKKALFSGLSRSFFLKNLLRSFITNGFCSIPVVGLTGFFTGGVLTLQLFISLKAFGIENTVPYIVLFALMKELAPVLCALTIVSRVGSSMSAEIGSMMVNNQMDVLTSMSINRYKFLYVPRILAAAIAQPILTTIAVIVGVFGSFVVSTNMFNFTDVYFCNLIYESFEWKAYLICIIKGVAFGFIISSIACYQGERTNNGAVGVKNATISTVVLCCVYILIVNFTITWLMN